MKMATMLSMLANGTTPLMFATARLGLSFFRVSFLAAASSEGLLALLRDGPVTLHEIMDRMAPAPGSRDGLKAWLDFGVSAGILERSSDRYGLRGRLAKQLAEPMHDAAAALIEEFAGLDINWIMRTPARLREGRKFALSEQDGRLVARSSRILEPVVSEAIDLVVPRAGACRLLDVGCGSGVYIRHAAARNANLTVVGIDLQPEVAAAARENLRRWGLEDRVAIEAGDVRQRPPDASFDAVLLNNNIYYFPQAERPALFAHLRLFLSPGGRLMITTPCAGGGAMTEILNLWGVMTEGCGPLPERERMVAQLREARFESVTAKPLIPFVRYYAFVAS
jgi:4-hydroxy-2,2'-bipyrrole-5-carbaldehyde O-methyltransferase